MSARAGSEGLFAAAGLGRGGCLAAEFAGAAPAAAVATVAAGAAPAAVAVVQIGPQREGKQRQHQ